jgi:sulfate/thiosulfate transport system permease protein
LNAIVDLPLAIPTLVTGIMLVILYGPQQALGSFMIEKLNFRIVFAPTRDCSGVVVHHFPVCCAHNTARLGGIGSFSGTRSHY